MVQQVHRKDKDFGETSQQSELIQVRSNFHLFPKQVTNWSLQYQKLSFIILAKIWNLVKPPLLDEPYMESERFVAVSYHGVEATTSPRGGKEDRCRNE